MNGITEKQRATLAALGDKTLTSGEVGAITGEGKMEQHRLQALHKKGLVRKVSVGEDRRYKWRRAKV